ncbi:MAG: hypothetical protein H8D23_04970 [Candidatus Brocadiales bacterium]|nr:hypothetical protein [Candidatus Brocadiales bacterium]
MSNYKIHPSRITAALKGIQKQLKKRGYRKGTDEYRIEAVRLVNDFFDRNFSSSDVEFRRGFIDMCMDFLVN